MRQILEKPTISAHSQPESFSGKAETYRYFLDHPDRAVVAWRRLGANCVSIQARGNQHERRGTDPVAVHEGVPARRINTRFKRCT